MPDSSRAWNVNLKGGIVAGGSEGESKRSGVGGRLHKLGGAVFRNKQQPLQNPQQGPLHHTPSQKMLPPSSPSTSAHKQRRQLERSRDSEVQQRSADKRPKAFEGGGGFLPPFQVKQPQQREQPQHGRPQPKAHSSVDIAPPSNPFYPQQQQLVSKELRQSSPKHQTQLHTQRQPPPQQKQQQRQQHHPRMALEKSLSKNAVSAGNTGRRVVVMHSPPLATPAVAPRPAATTSGKGHGGVARK